jgi:hypothetical protein
MRSNAARASLVLGAIVASGAAACTNDPVPPTLSAQQFCEEVARVDCHAYFDCFTEDMRATVRQTLPIGTTKGQCETNLRTPCAATPYTCPNQQIFQLQNAGACVRALNAVSCDSWRQDTNPAPAACMNVCIDNPV